MALLEGLFDGQIRIDWHHFTTVQVLLEALGFYLTVALLQIVVHLSLLKITHCFPLAVHLRACALKLFSLHFFNPSFGLTNLDGRLLTLPVDTVTILTLGHLARRKYS